MTKIVLTNDDGIDAPGLAALEAVARQFGDVVVVAPLQHLSGCSHRVTVDRPLLVTSHGQDRFAVDGTPVDCVRLALLHLCPEADWVLSGVNDGGNLGVDVWMSGTVAAAREAAFFGRHAIALSQYRRRGVPPPWESAGKNAARALRALFSQPPARGSYWNVNFPDRGDEISPEFIPCNLDPHPLPVRYELEDGGFRYRSAYQERKREPGCDVAVCFGGQIAYSAIPGAAKAANF